MYARVATFEGTDPSRARHKADEAKVLSITLFETEEDLRQGDAALNTTDPPGPGSSDSRRSVEVYDVAVKLDR